MSMDLKISKIQMELAIKMLERRAADIKGVPMFKGIPATAFDKEHLVMLCQLYADEWHKAQENYWEVLKGSLSSYIERARKILHKPSIWRRIWNKRKKA